MTVLYVLSEIWDVDEEVLRDFFKEVENLSINREEIMFRLNLRLNQCNITEEFLRDLIVQLKIEQTKNWIEEILMDKNIDYNYNNLKYLEFEDFKICDSYSKKQLITEYKNELVELLLHNDIVYDQEKLKQKIK